MFAGNPRPASPTPAKSDCEIFFLPTMASLSGVEPPGIECRYHRELWADLAIAVLGHHEFDELEFERHRDERLAEVIDLAAHRSHRRRASGT